MTKTSFSIRLEELMRERGMTNVALSKLLGCPDTSISAWRSKGIYPKAASLIKLSRFFGCSIEYILGISDSRAFTRSTTTAEFWPRFVAIATEFGATTYKIAKDCNIPRDYFSRWKKRGLTPETQTIIVLAAYLGCTVDQLLGNAVLRKKFLF